MQVFIDKTTVVSVLLLSVCMILILSNVTASHILKEGEIGVQSIGNSTYLIIRGPKLDTMTELQNYFLKLG